MLPLPLELGQIERSLFDRQITGDEAGALIFQARKKLGLPWQWKSWKEFRKNLSVLNVRLVAWAMKQFLFYNIPLSIRELDPS